MKYLISFFSFLFFSSNQLYGQDITANIHPFLCEHEPLIFTYAGSSWLISSNYPFSSTQKIDTGWRISSPNGSVGFLQQNKSEWVLNWLSEDGFEELECKDLKDSTRLIIDIIKPELSKNIIEIENELLSLRSANRLAQNELKLLRTLKAERTKLIEENENLSHHFKKLKKDNDQIRIQLLATERAADVNLRKFQKINESVSNFLSLIEHAEWLNKMVAASPAVRNPEIIKSKLMRINVTNNSDLFKCVALLRDKGKLGDICAFELASYLSEAK